MEYLEGETLADRLLKTPLTITETLRFGIEIASALDAAHRQGVVHRDLKPGNVMVTKTGAKLLDFGLAKVGAVAGVVSGVSMMPTTPPNLTVQGAILGTFQYMAPEQLEGLDADARTDIFAFGAVLYEMITGQRAFRGESRVSTLAAVVEKDPPPPSEISPTTPPEMERLIVRCLRKDVNRRSQNMADVKLALEELRDESESGKLTPPAAAAPALAHRLLWPALAGVSVLIAVATLAWTYLNYRGTQSKARDMVRLSPDDGHSYSQPAISPDGGFVAYISDRSGKGALWLQQVGGSDQIQLTHSSESVSCPSFFPDGKRILYVTTSADGWKSTIEVISALGGEPRVLIQGGSIQNVHQMLSPDGRQIAYFEYSQAGSRLMTASASGGRPRELSNWARMPGGWTGGAAWTSDSRYLLCLVSKSPRATDFDEFEWFAVPVDGGNPVATGAGDALRAAGLGLAAPALMAGDRVLFLTGPRERMNTWEIRLSPGSWRVRGDPRQLTFGTLSEYPVSISATGAVALTVAKYSTDIYLIPLSPATGQPTGVARRLTQDGRFKELSFVGGNPGYVYFSLLKVSRTSQTDYYALDLKSGKQTTLVTGPSMHNLFAVSPDGQHFAYSIPEADSFSIRVGDASAGFGDARVLCKTCGKVLQFSADGRFLFYQPQASVKPDPKQKSTVRLLEVASGKDLPWLEHPSDSVGPEIDTFGEDSAWVTFSVRPPGSQNSTLYYIVRWRPEPVPPSEWVKVPLLPSDHVILPTGNFFYFLQDSKLTAIHFNPKTRGIGEPYQVKWVPGSPVTLTSNDDWEGRGPGLVFRRAETASSVWLMKLPR